MLQYARNAGKSTLVKPVVRSLRDLASIDIKRSRPDNNELAGHFHQDGHDLDDLEVMILQTGLSKSRAQREYFEDKWICKLQTKVGTGINEQLHHYAKQMYQCFKP